MNRPTDPGRASRIQSAVLLLAAALLSIAANASVAQAKASVDAGRKLAIKRCSRCHVVGDYNRLGGIGSTPSFQIMTTLDDYIERFKTFHQRRPHPVFVRVPGFPRWSSGPAYAPVFEITVKQIDEIVNFVRTLKPKAMRN